MISQVSKKGRGGLMSYLTIQAIFARSLEY